MRFPLASSASSASSLPLFRFAFAFAFVPLALAAPALPCSPPTPSLDGPVVPDDGRALPVNGVVHADLSTFGTVTALVRADGSVTARRLDVDDVAGVSRINLEGLAPSTSYTLTLTMDADVVTEDGQERARDVHFTTARGADTTPPAFRGTPDVVVTHIPALEFVDSCGGGGVDENTIDILPPDLVEDGGLAGIKLLRVNDDGSRALRRFRLTERDDTDDQGALTDTQRTPGEYAYELVAVDLAGNESAPLSVAVSVPGAPMGCTSAGAAMPSMASTAVVLAVMLVRARRARMQS